MQVVDDEFGQYFIEEFNGQRQADMGHRRGTVIRMRGLAG